MDQGALRQQPHQTRQASVLDRVLPGRKKSCSRAQSQPPHAKPQGTRAPWFQGHSPYFWEPNSESKLFSGIQRCETGRFTIPIIPLPYHMAEEQVTWQGASRENQNWAEGDLNQRNSEAKEDSWGPQSSEKGLENWHHLVSQYLHLC